MKLTLTPNMEARRSEAEGRADSHFSRRMSRLARLPDLYRRKVEEATAWLGYRSQGPLITAEIAARGGEPDAIAQAILDKSKESGRALAAIEHARLQTKDRIRAAATPAELDAIVAELEASAQ